MWVVSGFQEERSEGSGRLSYWYTLAINAFDSTVAITISFAHTHWLLPSPLASLSAGWQCFRGLSPPCGGDCSLSPALPLAYLAVNLLFNVSALELIRLAGNVVMSLTMSSIVPLTILAFAVRPRQRFLACNRWLACWLAGLCAAMDGAGHGSMFCPV